MISDSINLTYGAELELADWDRQIKIPSELGVIDKNDITICNSNGVGVNPYNDSGFGGEINTVVCNTPDSLCQCIMNILNLLKGYTINYSCWLHIHVGFNNYNFSLEQLKDILKKVHLANKWIPLTNLTPVKQIDIQDNIKVDDNFIECLIRRNLTRQSCMTDQEYEGAMNADTLEQFWSYFDRKRHVVNMQSLYKNKTLEFRFFYMSDNYDKLLNSITFCRDFCNYILYDRDLYICDNYPNPYKINLDLESSYKKTKTDKRDKINNFTGQKW